MEESPTLNRLMGVQLASNPPSLCLDLQFPHLCQGSDCAICAWVNQHAQAARARREYLSLVSSKTTTQA